MVGDLAVTVRATFTRRGYVQILKGFHWFLRGRKAVEIEAEFGFRLVRPVDEFDAPGMSATAPRLCCRLRH